LSGFSKKTVSAHISEVICIFVISIVLTRAINEILHAV
jgi:hypothetical protein